MSPIDSPIEYFRICSGILQEIVLHKTNNKWWSVTISFEYLQTQHKQCNCAKYRVVIHPRSSNVTQVRRGRKDSKQIAYCWDCGSKIEKHSFCSPSSHLESAATYHFRCTFRFIQFISGFTFLSLSLFCLING